jgi:hypothetical protein
MSALRPVPRGLAVALGLLTLLLAMPRVALAQVRARGRRG